MNDPNKAIDVNLSSLLSLKAELLRKQAEVKKAKATRTPECIASRKSNSNITSAENRELKQKRAELVSKKVDATVYEHEDSALLEQSKRTLQAKSKYYERMSRNGGQLNSDDNCLVLFNRKKQEDELLSAGSDSAQKSSSESDSSASDDGGDDAHDSDDDWVEYTDCLGRTRKCLRKDLQEVKRRDTELAKSMPERLDQSKPNWMLDTKGTYATFYKNAHKNVEDKDEDVVTIGPQPTESILSDGCSLVSKHDEQRANWERKEQENFGKSDVHYQDVFFDEARQHGVGYYAFSTDDEERRRQQNELEDARQATLIEQEHRESLRAQREQIIEQRVHAARNRQRARIGLPPLPELEEVRSSTSIEEMQKETKEERKARKKADKLKKKQEAEELERERERQQHIRPWDQEKDGVASKSSNGGFDAATVKSQKKEEEWSYKAERLPMSQTEWNEQKRAERKPEFAPPPLPSSPAVKQKSKPIPGAKPKRINFSSMPPPPLNDNVPTTSTATTAQDTTAFSNFQSTRQERQFQKRSYEVDESASANTCGAAIPPPASLDVAVNPPAKAKKNKTSIELERSIEAGLRFLRNNCDKGTLSTKSSWTARADY